jgi:transposase
LVDTSETEEDVPMARYSKEFRENAVRLCEQGGWRVAETARELDVNYKTLYEWVSKARGEGVRTVHEDESLSDENRRLRRENQRLAEELEIAKKAAAFFARNQK